MARFAVEVAGFRSRVVMIGASTEPFTISSGELIWRELSVMGSRGFTPGEISAVLDLVNERRLYTDHLTADRRPWREADLALEDLSSGRTTRAVLIMTDD
jgi:D-arabinose 1-dehydrogenase-like Zn-dependent alcohol dehydrogenase